MPADSLVLAAGSRLLERELAALAAAGVARVPVHPQPRVVILTVGDDLVQVGRGVSPGLRPDAVSTMLVAGAERAGGSAFRGGPIRREQAAVAQAVLDQLVRADLIVVVGEDASPAGKPEDGLIARALRDAGCTGLDYCLIDPGAALGLTSIGDGEGIPLISIGADPLAAFVGFEVLVRPVIAALSGRDALFRPVVRARLTEQVSAPAGVRRFAPATVWLDTATTSAFVTPLDEPRSAAQFWLHRANALAIIPEGVTSLWSGDELAVIRLDRE